MNFEKRNFMGIELDVLVGHPEHDLLFVATQVARAAGLTHPSQSVAAFKNVKACDMRLSMGNLHEVYNKRIDLPQDISGKTYQNKTALLDESNVYRMLLRGNAPQSEPFRKWVTEEVLPSIRKTGKYNAEESTNPIAQSILDEIKTLRVEVSALRQELQAKTFSLTAPVAAEPSPYEGQPGVALCDPAGFNVKTYRELAEDILPRPSVDKLEPRVVLHLEVELSKKWDAEDGRRFVECCDFAILP